MLSVGTPAPKKNNCSKTGEQCECTCAVKKTKTAAQQVTAIVDTAENFDPMCPIQTMAQLIFAEERIDDLANGAENGAPLSWEYHVARANAIVFIRNNPELLDEPWVRSGGEVYDLIAIARESRIEYASRFAKPPNQ